MISSFDYYKQLESPDMYLCNPDQRILCAVHGIDRRLILRFNDLSELTFTVPKLEGMEDSYNLVEAKRLIFVEKIGWFQIVTVTETKQGDVCSKSVTTQSHQCIFSDRGFVTEERLYMFYNPNDPRDEKYKSENKAAIPSVCGQLHQQLGIVIAPNLSEVQEQEDRKVWTITYVDPTLIFRARGGGEDTMYQKADGAESVCRSFEANTENNGYDFMVNQVEKAFEVVFEFDFLHHTIAVRPLTQITQNTDICLSFQNVLNTLDIKEDSEDIVTVLNCKGNGLDITTVNPMGTNYIVDFSYYMQEKNEDGVDHPWMSEALINALNGWKTECSNHEKEYAELVADLQDAYAKKAVYDADLQYAKLKITDIKAVQDQYIGQEEKELEESGYFTAESVEAGKTSLLKGTTFNTTAFTEDSELTGYKKAPTPVKQTVTEEDENGNVKTHDVYVFRFGDDDAGTPNTAKELIAGYIDAGSKDEAIEECPLYFQDEDLRSYCKLTVKSEVAVVKDDDGFIVEEGTGKAEFRRASENAEEETVVTFTVEHTEGGCTVTMPNGDTKNLSFNSSNPALSYFNYDGGRYRAVISADNVISLYYFYVSGFDRYTTYPEASGDTNWIGLWTEHIKKDVEGEIQEWQGKIDAVSEDLKSITDKCDVQKYIQGKGQALYDELTTYWVEGSYSNDNYAVNDDTTMAERIDLAGQLMEAARTDLARSSQPKYELTVDAVNFIKLTQFKPFTDQLALGRKVTLEKSDDVYLNMALMSIEYDLDASDACTFTFSNATRPDETAMTFADLIKESSSISRTVAANWSNLTDYAKNRDDITNLILYPLDRTLRAAQDNLYNQQFLVDESGILGRKWADDSGTTFENEQMRILNNTILFTQDNWKTAALALGKVQYGSSGETAYGLAADVLVGNLLFGSKMTIKNEGGHITFDGNGITVRKDETGDPTFHVSPDGEVTISSSAKSSDENGATALRGTIQTSVDGLKIAFAKTTKPTGEEAETSAFGYTFTADEFAVWNSDEGNPVLQCNESGLRINGNGTFTGTIEANEGHIGKLRIAPDGSIASDNALFSVDKDGYLTAKSGMIGNLELNNGDLISSNFMITTGEGTDGKMHTRLSFIDPNGEEVSHYGEGMKAQSVGADIGTFDQVALNTLVLNGGLVADGTSIRNGDTKISFATNATKTYTVNLSEGSAQNKFKLSVANGDKMPVTMTFAVEYTYWKGISTKTAQVEVSLPEGATEQEFTVDYVITGLKIPSPSGRSHYSYTSDGKRTAEFVRNEPSGVIRIDGDLVPNGSHSLGQNGDRFDNVYAKNGTYNKLTVEGSEKMPDRANAYRTNLYVGGHQVLIDGQLLVIELG